MAVAVPLISLAVSAVATGVQMQQQKKAAKAAADRQRQAAEEAAQAERDAQKALEQQEALRLSQEEERAAREIARTKLLGEKERSAAKLSAVESGVGGVALQDMLADFQMQEQFLTESIFRQQELNRQGSQLGLNTSRSQSDRRVQTFLSQAPKGSKSSNTAGYLGIVGNTLSGLSNIDFDKK